jgi:hypothetical protein
MIVLYAKNTNSDCMAQKFIISVIKYYAESRNCRTAPAQGSTQHFVDY